MATTVTSTRTAERKTTTSGGGSKFPGPNGKGPKGNGWEKKDPQRGLSPAAYRMTMWVVLAAIVMMFAALSSAYIILSVDTARSLVSMPRMFFLSTGIILLSSLTFETGKRSLKCGNETRYLRWIIATLVLGLLFLAAQLMGWRELAAQGVYFAGHPHSTFFYLFTGVHGAHLLGGIAGLSCVAIRARKSRQAEKARKQTFAGLMSLYWHTMGALWIWLFLLLLIWK